MNVTSFERNSPRVSSILSFVFNLFLIFLICTDKKTQLGKYRYLLLAFSYFNILYSIVLIFVPMGVDESFAFTTYLVEGPFFNTSFGQISISIRCSFISISYSLLIIHFVYRYLVIFKLSSSKLFFFFQFVQHNNLSSKLFQVMIDPLGIFVLFLFVIFHGIIWTLICQFFLVPNEEARSVLQFYFKKTYDADTFQMPMLVIFYRGTSSSTIIRGLIGLILLSFISIYSISIYIILGYKIMKKLNQNSTISKITQNLHRQLFKTLLVQTLIPLLINFIPCIVAWYIPLFNIGIEGMSIVLGFLSTFTFLDPIAIIFLIPSFRKRTIHIFNKNYVSEMNSSKQSNSRH